jgi:hypothetical protein
LTLCVWKQYALTLGVWKANALALVVWKARTVAGVVRTPYALTLVVWALLAITLFFFFFFVYSYSHEAYLDYGGVHFDRFPAVVRTLAARCKLPFAIRPGVSHEKKKIVIRKGQMNDTRTFSLLFCRSHKGGRGEE